MTDLSATELPNALALLVKLVELQSSIYPL
jgi:hypothetical protein